MKLELEYFGAKSYPSYHPSYPSMPNTPLTGTSWLCVSCFQHFMSLKCLNDRQVYWKEKKNIEVCNYRNGATQSWENTTSRRVKEKGRNGVHKFWPGYCVAFRLSKKYFLCKSHFNLCAPCLSQECVLSWVFPCCYNNCGWYSPCTLEPWYTGGCNKSCQVVSLH